MKEKIILFDLDGTLIDSTQAVYEGFCEVFKSFNEPLPTKEQLSREIGHTLDDMFLKLGAKNDIDKHIAMYKNHYKQICKEKTKLLEHAKEGVLKASEFANLGVVTTKTGEYSKILLEHFEILKYFTCVIGRENVTHAKPNAEPILKALSEIPSQIKNENIFMIGDTPLDIMAAKNAKIQGKAVLSGYSTKEQLAPYTSDIYANVLEAVLSIKEKKS